MKKILLCPPTFYDIEYEINPWMHVENKVNKEKVLKEYEELKSTYKSLGAEILEIEPVDGLPDMVYAANLGFPIANNFVVSNFKYSQRKKEAGFAQKYFEDLGFKIIKLPKEIYFEGQGDFLTDGEKFFMGWGKRSSKDAVNFLSENLNVEIVDLELKDPYFYHLDMSFAPLNKDTALINERSFIKKDLEKIYKCYNNVITSSEADNKIFACNLVVIGKTIVLGKGISDELGEKIKNVGFEIKEVPMGEFRKGGGSVKCLTLEFY